MSQVKIYDNKPGWREIRYSFAGEVQREFVKEGEALKRMIEVKNYLITMQKPLTSTECEQYRLLLGLLGDIPLADAVSFFKRHKAEIRTEVTWGDVIAEWATEEGERGVSLDTVRVRKSKLEDFGKSCVLPNNTKLSETGIDHVRKFLTRYNNHKTRNNVRSMLIGFYDWAHANKYYFHENPARQLRPAKVDPADPVPFTSDAVEAMLRAAVTGKKWDAALLTVLGALAGVRMKEICRLKWEDFYGDDEGLNPFDYITLSSTVTKTNKRRAFRLDPVTQAWLEFIFSKLPKYRRTPESLVIHYTNPSRCLREVADTAGVPWVVNGLRKGFVSCMARIHPDIREVAKLTGHTVEVLESEYKALVSTEEANKWFSYYPPA